jgi:hypothetical protein
LFGLCGMKFDTKWRCRCFELCCHVMCYIHLT